jgi:hypothetical protein
MEHAREGLSALSVNALRETFNLPGVPMRLTRREKVSSFCSQTRQRLGQPSNDFDGGAQGRFLGAIGGTRIITHGCPSSGVFDVPAKLLKAVCPVRTSKQIDTSIVLAVLDAVEDDP